MRIKKHLLKKFNFAKKISKFEISDILLTYLTHGRIIDPLMVNLDSFDPSLQLESDLDLSGDLNDHHLYAWERFFKNGKKLISTEFKIYFYKNTLRTNGLSIAGNFRLCSFLKKIHESQYENGVFLPQIYLSKNLKEGGILFTNGILMQFSSGARGTAKNYYIKTVESNFDATGQFDEKEKNQDFIKSLFNEFNYEKLNPCTCKGNLALQKLINQIKSFHPNDK